MTRDAADRVTAVRNAASAEDPIAWPPLPPVQVGEHVFNKHTDGGGSPRVRSANDLDAAVRRARGVPAVVRVLGPGKYKRVIVTKRNRIWVYTLEDEV